MQARVVGGRLRSWRPVTPSGQGGLRAAKAARDRRRQKRTGSQGADEPPRVTGVAPELRTRAMASLIAQRRRHATTLAVTDALADALASGATGATSGQSERDMYQLWSLLADFAHAETVVEVLCSSSSHLQAQSPLAQLVANDPCDGGHGGNGGHGDDCERWLLALFAAAVVSLLPAAKRAHVLDAIAPCVLIEGADAARPSSLSPAFRECVFTVLSRLQALKAASVRSPAPPLPPLSSSLSPRDTPAGAHVCFLSPETTRVDPAQRHDWPYCVTLEPA